MLIALKRDVIGRAAALTGTGGKLRHEIEKWSSGRDGIPGVAVFDVDLSSSLHVDALVFLPYRLLVIQVTRMTRKQAGTLAATDSGQWRVGEEPAALPGDEWAPNPASRVQKAVHALRSRIGGGTGSGALFVTGVAVLLPKGTGLRLPGTGLHGSAKVVLGIDVELRQLLRSGKASSVWSADDVVKACDALSLGDVTPSREELIADGFPEVARTPARASAASAGPPRRPWGLIVLITLLCVVGLVAAIVVAQVFHGG
jgi:hypothetical protein